VSHGHPESGCAHIELDHALRMDELAEVALEDYARALARAERAEAVRSESDASLVTAVHLCGITSPPTDAIRTDLRDFARGLGGEAGGGLGWG
jgi:hypothetical protein